MTANVKFFAASALAVSLAVSASAASAATYVEPWTSTPTGGISVAFGDNGLGVDGAETIPGETASTHSYDPGSTFFTDNFAFNLPDGVVGFTLSSIGFLTNSALVVSSFTWNGVALSVTNTPSGDGGNIVMASGGPLPVVAGGPQLLTITGTGGPQAVFSGTATFDAAAPVPEPAAWALMIMGFGGTGALMRRRRATLSVA
ncbi:FxDxF family PEP-CTERM protein [Phenylobacterium sp.]|uniref:FxDxF family PEP-CTERM protein n=1 Tax=Phenylobacterium sp. TaxID=1871053 RepID=UPI0025ED7695|nr:FxDxF family PEP-CTERM protein [Phenylobacterium sp.]